MFSLFGVLRLHDHLFWLLTLFHLLEVVLGFGLGHFDGSFPGIDYIFFMRSSSFVGWVFNLDKGNVVTNHFFGHFIQLFGLFVDPLCDCRGYVVCGVVEFAIVPDELDISQAPLNSVVGVIG